MTRLTIEREPGGSHAVDRGEVACGFCGAQIAPGAPWDLSHPHDDKTLPPVPWHRRCNRQYAAAVTRRRRATQRRANQ